MNPQDAGSVQQVLVLDGYHGAMQNHVHQPGYPPPSHAPTHANLTQSMLTVGPRHVATQYGPAQHGDSSASYHEGPGGSRLARRTHGGGAVGRRQRPQTISCLAKHGRAGVANDRSHCGHAAADAHSEEGVGPRLEIAAWPGVLFGSPRRRVGPVWALPCSGVHVRACSVSSECTLALALCVWSSVCVCVGFFRHPLKRGQLPTIQIWDHNGSVGTTT